MRLSIILRTVCGCERILEIPFKEYPDFYAVPYLRNKNYWIAPADGDTCMSAPPVSWGKRTFERTGRTGIYNYQVYLEMLKEDPIKPSRATSAAPSNPSS